MYNHINKYVYGIAITCMLMVITCSYRVMTVAVQVHLEKQKVQDNNLTISYVHVLMYLSIYYVYNINKHTFIYVVPRLPYYIS